MEDVFLLRITDIDSEVDELIKVLRIESMTEIAATIISSCTLNLRRDIVEMYEQAQLSVIKAQEYLEQTDVSKARACISLGLDALWSMFVSFGKIFRGGTQDVKKI